MATVAIVAAFKLRASDNEQQGTFFKEVQILFRCLFIEPKVITWWSTEYFT
jgi:hypothetical protein